jgi:hypothetical protein
MQIAEKILMIPLHCLWYVRKSDFACAVAIQFACSAKWITGAHEMYA